MPLLPIPYAFPARGVDVSHALEGQPEGTCPDARNVRTFEVNEERARGGQRPGTEKAFATLMSSDANTPRVEEIGVMMVPTDTSEGSIPETTQRLIEFTNAEGWDSGDNIEHTSQFNDIVDPTEATAAEEASGAAMLRIGNGGTGNGDTHVRLPANDIHMGLATGITVPSGYEVIVRISDNSGGAWAAEEVRTFGSSPSFGIAVRVNESDWQSALFVGIDGVGGGNASWGVYKEAAGVQTQVYTSGNVHAGSDINPSGGDYMELIVRVIGDEITLTTRMEGSTEEYEWGSTTTTELNTQEGIGISLADTTDFKIYYFEVKTQEPAPFARRDVYVVPMLDGNAYSAKLTEDNTLALTALTGTFFASAGTITSMSLFQKIYAVNGSSGLILDPIAGTISAWTATAGTRPDGYIVAAYRGSAVIAGDPTDSNNMYISAVEDPLDFDYGADPIETSAFALDNSDLGKNPDPIMALIPWSDDLMLIGGTGSIRQMTGDPRAGGRIDTVTESLGILGPKAWTIGNGGEIYFMGNDGFYRMPAGSKRPENLSRGRLDSILSEIDYATNIINVSYNSQHHGVHVFITPFDYTAGVHVFYSIRDNAFWLDSFPADQGPSASVKVYGNTPNLRNVIMGGLDGYVYRFDNDAKDDGSTAISSYVQYAPVLPAGGLQMGTARELQIVSARGADALTWELRGGESAEDLVDDLNTLKATGSFTTAASFRTPARTSLRFGALSLRLSNILSSSSWQMERALIRMKPAGRRRGV